MAKYSRFDTRNKKSGKHKLLSQNKDIRIRETEETKNKNLLREVVYDDDNWGTSYLEESVGRDRLIS